MLTLSKLPRASIASHHPISWRFLKHIPTHQSREENRSRYFSPAAQLQHLPCSLHSAGREGRMGGGGLGRLLSSEWLYSGRWLKATEFIFRWPQRCPVRRNLSIPKTQGSCLLWTGTQCPDFLGKGLLCALLTLVDFTGARTQMTTSREKSVFSFLPCVGPDSTAFDGNIIGCGGRQGVRYPQMLQIHFPNIT